MFILDTNVISELMKEIPDSNVVSWVGEHDAAELYTTAIAQAEIGFGIAKMANGKRKKALQSAYNDIFERVFTLERVLPFDSDAARSYSLILSSRTAIGRPISVLDAQTAAICDSWKAMLVTRNARDFELIKGVETVNPFD